MESRLPRRLTVILHADVVEYSRLSGEDEDLTHRSLQDSLRLISAQVTSYHGRIANTAGDAVLAMFDSVADALSCAIAIQEKLANKNRDIEANKRLLFRIGIHLGDVIEESGDIFGDGVNIAARLEGLAAPGEICISESVYTAVKGKMPIVCNSLGAQEVKNIEGAIKAYQVRLSSGVEVPPPSQRQTSNDDHSSRRTKNGIVALAILALVPGALALIFPHYFRLETPSVTEVPVEERGVPTVAVLPFDNLSDDPDQQYFSDGISDDVITDLSRLSGISVIARNSSYGYRDDELETQEIANALGATHIVNGSVRRQDKKVRINVAVIDTGKNVQIWAERFDRNLEDIFAIQDEITSHIVSALSIRLTGDEEKHIQNRATSDFAAYDLFLKGLRLYSMGSKESVMESKAAYRQAIERDPGFARPYGALAVALMREVLRGWSLWPQEMRRRAMDLADNAVGLDPNSQEVHWAMGFVNLYNKNHEAAIEAAKRSIEIAPNYGDAYGLLALISNWMGRSEDAIQYAMKGMQLNPHYSWDYPYNIGRAHYQLKNHDAAETHLLQALERNPAALPAQMFLIANYARAGNLEEAEWLVTELSISNPEISISQFSENWPFFTDELKEYVVSDLRSAGIPE